MSIREELEMTSGQITNVLEMAIGCATGLGALYAVAMMWRDR
jgi:hypothetical protein